MDIETKKEAIKMFEDMSSTVQMVIGDRSYSRSEIIKEIQDETDVGRKIVQVHQSYKDSFEDA